MGGEEVGNKPRHRRAKGERILREAEQNILRKCITLALNKHRCGEYKIS
jgi:hypothetical protein